MTPMTPMTPMTTTRIAVCCLCCFLALGCSKKTPTEGSLASPTASSSLHETPDFKLTIEKDDTYTKDQPGVAHIRLQAKGNYKINEEYPFKFVCQDPAPEGISYPKPTLKRTDGKFDKTEGLIDIPFVPTKSGTLQVGGVFSLSVCTEAHCLIEKRPLVVDIPIP